MTNSFFSNDTFWNQAMWSMFDATLKSMAVFLFAVVAIQIWKWVNRRQSQVHVAHRIWVVVMLAVLTLPILGVFVPHISIPVAMNGLPSDSREAAHEPLTKYGSTNPFSNREVAQREEIEFSKNLTAGESPISNLDYKPGFDLPPQSDGPDRGFANGSAYAAAVNPGISVETQSRFTVSALGFVLSLIWLVGIVSFSLRFQIASCKKSGVVKRSQEILTREYSPELGSRCLLLQSLEIDSPVVVGLIRPRIILPMGWENWPAQKLGAVIAHETAHVRRWDGLVHFLAELTSIIHWFNPVAWIARAQLSRLAELACDESAAIATGDRVGYARQLLSIAAQVRSRRVHPGIAMAARSKIAHRIDSLIVRDRSLATSVSRAFAAILILIAVPSLLVVAAARPDFSEAEQGKQGNANDSNSQSDVYMDSIRSEGNENVMKFRCTSFLPDGKMATNLVATAQARHWRGNSKTVPCEVSIVDNRAEIEVRMPFDAKSSLLVSISTSDKSWIGQAIVASEDLHGAARNGIRVELAEPRRARVKVVDDGEVVVGANVHVNAAWGGTFTGKTNDEGYFNYIMPKTTSLSDFSAWTDDSRIGGFMFYRDPPRDPAANEHVVELHPCRRQKVSSHR